MSLSEFSQQITFLHSNDLQKTRQFYEGLLNLKMVRDQATCQIFCVTNHAFLGFCEHIEPISTGRKVILTLVTEDVDAWYESLKKRGADLMEPPQGNPNYQIYHFFLLDPNGYWIEVQRFAQPL